MPLRRKNHEPLSPVGGETSFDLPQAFPDDLPIKEKVEPRLRNRKGQREEASPGGGGWVVSFTLMMIVVVVASYFLVSHHEQVLFDHLRQDIIHEQVEPLSREWEEKYSRLEEENAQLKKDAANNVAMKEEYDQLEQEKGQFRKLRLNQDKQITELTRYKKKMQQNIQLMSRTILLEKFGPGPHHVEITLVFDPSYPKLAETDDTFGRIVIEMAPVNEMPHAVYWFLEQVSHKLYDGCSFHRNAGHVMQGGPTPNFLSPPDPQLHKRFKDAGFYSILFQEYSPNFPHKKYTMGLAGRPGGPDFYISTKDNSKLHGPDGQSSYDDPTEADPCFAKVIAGTEVVDRMQLGPLKPGGYKGLQKNVAIVSMKILET